MAGKFLAEGTKKPAQGRQIITRECPSFVQQQQWLCAGGEGTGTTLVFA